MQQCRVLYKCYILLSIFGITLSFYVPSMRTSRHHRVDASHLSTSRSHNRDSLGIRWRKRDNWFGAFKEEISGHARLHDDKRRFVNKMFQLFDINRDGCVSAKEFRSILFFLTIL